MLMMEPNFAGPTVMIFTRQPVVTFVYYTILTQPNFKRMMDMRRRVHEVHLLNVSSSVRIHLLNQIVADCLDEMEAQEQNMHPEIEHNLAEGYRMAKNYARILCKKHG